MLKTPIIIVNFKTYRSATGKNALKLAKLCEKIAKEKSVSIAVCVQATDIKTIADKVSIPVLAEHIDPVTYGSHTGHILPEAVKEAGAIGTLLNHSEIRTDYNTIKESLKRARELKLKTIICAKDDAEGEKLSKLNPDFIAVEPPELIGGKISVSSAKPELISNSVKRIGKNVLVGAGIHTKEDVAKALELGSVGVLLASGVTKAKNPEKVLKELAKGISRLS